jgi:hypothetical protein
MPSVRQKLIDSLNDDEALIFYEPPEYFDGAIVGLVRGSARAEAVLYDERAVLRAMVETGMDEEEAREHFEINTIGAYVGEHTPLFVTRLEDLE